MNTKRIALVDDNLDNFHANTYLDAIRGPLASRGWEVSGATSLQPDVGGSWAEKKGVPYFDSIGKLAKFADAFAVLAPSTPEKHLELCEEVLPYGKPTFVDKTFAPDTSTAKHLFELADLSNTPIQTTSALRNTNVQQAVATLESPLIGMALWAGGASFDEYGIHPVELAVSCLGHEVERLTGCGQGPQKTYLLEFSGERVATIHFSSEAYIPFHAVLTTSDGVQPIAVEEATLFVDAASSILDFFEAGEALVPRAETLAIMRVLDAVRCSDLQRGWVQI